MTISLDSLTGNPTGSENGLVVRNIPSGIQSVEITDGYGNVLGTNANPVVTTLGSVSRTTLAFVAFNFLGAGTTETMITLTPYSNFVAGTSNTSFSIDSGKTLRIQSIVVSGSSAPNSNPAFRLRISDSGSVTTSTPVIVAFDAIGGAINTIAIPGGMELSGSMQFGLSQYNSGSGSSFSITIIAYEY